MKPDFALTTRRHVAINPAFAATTCSFGSSGRVLTATNRAFATTKPTFSVETRGFVATSCAMKLWSCSISH
jgi:hypothetical protein